MRSTEAFAVAGPSFASIFVYSRLALFGAFCLQLEQNHPRSSIGADFSAPVSEITFYWRNVVGLNKIA